jgi:hypothetical protein
MTLRRPKVYDPSDVSLLFASVNEAALQERLRRLCRTLSLPHYHTHDSRRSEGGFPDSVIVRAPQDWGRPWLVIVELKSEKGRLTDEQTRWGVLLRAVEAAAGGALCYRVVRPSTWERLVGLLTAGREGDAPPVPWEDCIG